MAAQGNKNKPTILLVDDSKLVRFAGEKILGAEFHLLLAEDGAEAWNMLGADDSIQLVLSDLQMPVLDGFGLLEKIRLCEDERINALPIIMITGAESKEGLEERAMELGATDFIGKPFDHAHLKARVRAHVGHNQQKRSLLEHINIDTVTGLLNREGFESRLDKDAAFVSRHQHSLAVMLLQLDDYKPLFENIGRDAYNSILQRTAKLLQKSVRKEDTIARGGIAQFLVSLPTALPEAASGLAHRIAGNIEANNIKVNGQIWPLSLSIGVFTSPQGCTVEAAAALQGAREALQQSLAKGNNQITVIGGDQAAHPLPVSLDQLLRHLQANGELPVEVNNDQLATALRPLVALLSEQEKRQLLS